MLLLILEYVHIYNYLHLRNFIKYYFYSVIHHNPLHITQLANHPMCSIVYTDHPIYIIFP